MQKFVIYKQWQKNIIKGWTDDSLFILNLLQKLNLMSSFAYFKRNDVIRMVSNIQAVVFGAHKMYFAYQSPIEYAQPMGL